MAEVQVGRGAVDAELDPQGSTGVEAVGQVGQSDDALRRTAEVVENGLRCCHGLHRYRYGERPARDRGAARL